MIRVVIWLLARLWDLIILAVLFLCYIELDHDVRAWLRPATVSVPVCWTRVSKPGAAQATVTSSTNPSCFWQRDLIVYGVRLDYSPLTESQRAAYIRTVP